MKHIILVIYLLIVAFGVQAQKEDLKKMSADFEALLLTNKTFHLPYAITIASAMDTTVEHMDFDLYKANDKDYIRMGKSQEIIHDGVLLLVVNHEARIIRIGVDTANVAANQVLISNFVSTIDSSTSIQVDTKDGNICYSLKFPASYMYASVALVFSKKTKHLHQVEAVFSDAYPSEFRYIRVDYKEPDFKWVPEPGFPNTTKFVAQSNGRYVVQDAYDSYKMY